MKKKKTINIPENNRNKMLIFLSILLVPVMTLIYGIGDEFHLWDILSGRNLVIKGLTRLHEDGYPKSWIYSNEPEFQPLFKFISNRTKNPKIKELNMQRIYPSMIIIDGGLVRKSPAPPDFPITLEIPESSLIMYFYGVTRDVGDGKATWACRLSDVNNWIIDTKSIERFWVGVVLINITSLIFGVYLLPRKQKQR